MLFAHEFFEPGENIRMLFGHVRGFVRVFAEVVKPGANLDGRLPRTRYEFLANGLPIADADGLLTLVTGKFAIQKRSRRLWFSQQRRREADAVNLRRSADFRPDHFQQG